METRRQAPVQQDWGWTIEAHRERDQRLRRIRLPRSLTVATGSVSQDKVRSVLDRLNYYCWGNTWCYCSLGTLAEDTGNHERTIRRVLEALQSLGLITIDLRKSDQGIVINHYRINWGRVDELSQASPHPEMQVVGDRPCGHPDTNRDRVTDRSGCPGGHPDRTDRTFSGDRSDIFGGASGHGVTNRDRVPTKHGMDMENMEETPFHSGAERAEAAPASIAVEDGGGVSEKDGGWGAAVPSAPLPPVPSSRFTLRPGLATEDLADVATIEKLWRTATEAGLLPETPYWRETFYGLCRSIWRNRDKLANPVGLLHHKLRSGQQAILDQVDDAHDRAWAREQLRQQTEIPRLSLEDQWGPVLDALNRESLLSLAARSPLPWVRKHLRQHGLTKSIRQPLLKALEECGGQIGEAQR